MAPHFQENRRNPAIVLPYDTYEASFLAQYITAFSGDRHNQITQSFNQQSLNHPTQPIPAFDLRWRERQRPVRFLYPYIGVLGAVIHRDLHNHATASAWAQRAI